MYLCIVFLFFSLWPFLLSLCSCSPPKGYLEICPFILCPLTFFLIDLLVIYFILHSHFVCLIYWTNKSVFVLFTFPSPVVTFISSLFVPLFFYISFWCNSTFRFCHSYHRGGKNVQLFRMSIFHSLLAPIFKNIFNPLFLKKLQRFIKELRIL